MGLFHKLLGLNRANDEGRCQPDTRADDQLVRQVRELQAHVAEMRAEVKAARALLRELGRRYPYTS